MVDQRLTRHARTPAPQKLRNWRSLVFVGCVCGGLFVSASLAQEARRELKATFYQSFRGGDPKNPNLNPIRADNFRWETEGARVTMPAGKGKIPTAGVAATFKIKGDFEITASYEILKAEKPTEGYGVGVNLFIAIDPNGSAMHAVGLARRIGAKGNVSFLSDRMKPKQDGTGTDHLIRGKTSKHVVGKLRVERTGSMARFLVAEGDKPEFVAIVQNGKTKQTEIEFGADDIRYFQLGGETGDSEAALDVRLLDLGVRAEELPGLVEVGPPKRPTPTTMSSSSQANSRVEAPPATNWLFLPAMIASAGTLLAGLGLVAWFLVHKRRKRVKSASGKTTNDHPDQSSATVSFTCPNCDKRLKAKVRAAGRSIKCPDCGAATTVPDDDGFEVD